jgi:hypothetical protein
MGPEELHDVDTLMQDAWGRFLAADRARDAALLQAVEDGMTDAQIGEVLGVSRQDAHRIVWSARQACGPTTR